MRALIIALVAALTAGPALAEISISIEGGVTGLTSNAVIDIGHDSLSVWLGTGGGASVSTDNGTSWTTFGTASGLPTDDISAMAVNNRGAWIAHSHSDNVSGESIPYGDGISLTQDQGQTWTTFTPKQATFPGMLAYDMALYDSIAFAACFYGGLIRSTDHGLTWENLFPSQLDTLNTDSLDYHGNLFRSFNNRFFSVHVDTTGLPDTLSIWGGSAAGINRFMFYRDTLTSIMDNYPDSIVHIFHEDTTVVDSLRLPGNFVVAMGVWENAGTKRIWAACRPAFTGNLRVAYSQNNGATWHEAEIGGFSNAVEAWDFSFYRDTVYVATSDGLFRSQGNYTNWTLLSGFRDINNQSFYQDNAAFYAVDIVSDVVWAGGSDGAVKRQTGGGWSVYRSARDANDHFAYPSPFSPYHSTRRGTTIHFKPAVDTRATITIYDLNLELVRNVVNRIYRLGGVESDDIVWDGANGNGDIVANGIYYYRIELDSGEDLWGKVVVIK